MENFGVVDPNQIYGFIDSHHRTQYEWQQGNTDGAGRRTHPYEQALHVTFPTELNPPQSNASSRVFGGGSWSSADSSVYDGASTAASSRGSSKVSRSSHNSSVFDNPTSHGSTVASSRPSRHSNFRPATVGVQSIQAHAEVPLLPCEFTWEGYQKCDMYFHPHETDLWIDHVISDHLHHQLPSKALCWFCDDVEFDSKDWGDRRATFDARMDHIRTHIYEGKTVRDIRPDFHFLDHMRRFNLVTSEEAKRVRNYTEGSQLEDIYEHDYEPDEHARKDEVRAQVIIDQQKEDRQRRKHHHHHQHHRRRQ